ncbi:TetR/AcrR family transcriptional regulator [Bifidobacterium cuniculi]|uniref:Transcriptional regulator n=1 Tax=Bifidobacterium cuniculi TaxID=1688 RepID=A0A087ATA4_9BIFI|nr:TetR/AcrR family transcriptional regulator [Bifidobacterium cuniculi]KFI62004.1 transcriptional regulator [Bifidobacterium cuniculi]
MAKTLTESRRTRYTRSVLQDTMVELLREKSMPHITVSELCSQADVNRSTFYAHYDGLEDLLHDVEGEAIDHVSAAFDDLLSQSDPTDAETAIRRICAYIADNRSHLQVLMSSRADLDFQRRLMGLLYQHDDEIMQLQPASNDPNENRLRLQFAIHGAIGLIQYWLDTGLEASPEQVAQTIIDMSMPKQHAGL